MSAYVATVLVGAQLGIPHRQWVALAAASAATVVTVRIIDGGGWRVGILVPPAAIARELFLGIGFATLLILLTDALIWVSTDLRHVSGRGFPWREVAAVLIPAAVHEEVVFRGYLFQKLHRWNRVAGIAISSGFFAVLHLHNPGVHEIALANLFLGGVLLALAWERTGNLWLPIGIHLAWNVVSGPILGYPVGGYVAQETLFQTVTSGPAWLTGGIFGIEASVWMLGTECAGILFMMRAPNGCLGVPRRRHFPGAQEPEEPQGIQ